MQSDERAGSKYISGGTPQPSNGRIIGHIIGHIIGSKFVPKVERTAANGPEMLSYGSAALARSVTQDILFDLLAIYQSMILTRSCQ
jgi:hypothetical protein